MEITDINIITPNNSPLQAEVFIVIVFKFKSLFVTNFVLLYFININTIFLKKEIINNLFKNLLLIIQRKYTNSITPFY